MLIPPERLHEEMAILAALSKGQSVPPFDTVRLTKDGRRLDLSVTISPIRDASGQVVGAAKIARDVTQQRRDEAALRKGEMRLRFAFEAARIGDWEINLETRNARHSVRHDRCFGYDTLQEDWSVERFIDHVHPEDRPGMLRSFGHALSTASDWHSDFRVIWPDASVHWISAHGSVLHEAGHSPRMLGIVTDITSQKQADAARAKALALEAENLRIQEASRVKSQFLAHMSHELRTPLNAVIGFADILKGGSVPAGSPRHDQYLGHIADSGRHLLQLINDVLDLAKVESGTFEFRAEALDLARLVGEVSSVLGIELQRQQLQLRLDLDTAPQGLQLDPARLKQVRYNYLSNAIKFTPAGGTVTLRALPEGVAQWRIEVEDTGVGIAESDLPRLFVDFQQLDSGYSKRHSGTGLGLPLTRRLVQAQGGSVGVRSVFHTLLPQIWPPSSSSATARLVPDSLPVAAAPTAVPRDPPRAPDRLLVIDEDQAVRARIAQGLAGAGIRLDVASNASQAVQRAGEHRYRAITLGLHLPEQGGLQTLADIRRQGNSRTAAVLGMTLANADAPTAAFSIADVLAMPLRANEVLAVMARSGLLRHEAAKVMVIDDDSAALDLMCATLDVVGLECLPQPDPHLALQTLDRLQPHAIILDVMMPGMDGFEVLDALRQMPRWRNTPVFIWTSLILTRDEYSQLARSARAIVGKGGGDLDSLIDRLRRWQPVAAQADLGSR